MSIYLHIVIAQERRTEMVEGINGKMIPKRPQALVLFEQADEKSSVPTSLEVTDCTSDLQHTVTDMDGKERVIKGTDLANPNILMVRRWDTSKPYFEVLKGADVVPFTSISGWPELTKEEYDALPVPDPALP